LTVTASIAVTTATAAMNARLRRARIDNATGPPSFRLSA
jgi:hypothetical protein